MNVALLNKTLSPSRNYCGILILYFHTLRSLRFRTAADLSLRDKSLSQRLDIKIMVLGDLTSCKSLGRHQHCGRNFYARNTTFGTLYKVIINVYKIWILCTFICSEVWVLYI